MNRLFLPLVVGMLCAFLSSTAFAQSVTVQIIHNAPDMALNPVDVLVDGNVAVDDLAFREGTKFLTISLSSNIQVDFGLGPTNIPLPPLTAGETYVIMATGILPTSTGYDASVEAGNNSDIDFNIIGVEATNDTTTAAGSVNIAVAHGVTDADTVDVLANGGPLIDDLAYEEFRDYATVPNDLYVLQVTPWDDNSTVLASYYANLPALGLDGEGIVVFASGFLNPANNNNGPGFGLFAMTRNGGPALPLPTVGSAEAQIIHNSADPLADTVDIYIDISTTVVKLDDVAFREATEFLGVPAGYPLDVVIAGKTSTDITDQVVTTIPATFDDGESYVVVATGVVGAGFASNPDGIDSSFTLLAYPGARKTAATAGEVDLLVHHGSTDAPSVGIAANGGLVVDSAAYKDFAGYLGVPAAEYRVDVTANKDGSNVLFPFVVDLSGFADAALTVFASGFVTPGDNNGGPGFGLFAVGPAGGQAIALTPVGNARVQVIHNSADPAAATVDIYVDVLSGVEKFDDVPFRGATAFNNLPTGYEIDIVVAAPTSTGITDQAVDTFSVTLMDGDTLYAVANGVLDTTGFSTGANGDAIFFNLFVSEAREVADDNSMFDLKVFHGATDAPAVDVTVNEGIPALIDSLTYGKFTDFVPVMPAAYELGVGANPVTATSDLLVSFDADLSTSAGEAGLILASGFLSPEDEPTGALSFGLLFVQPDGTATLLPVATNVADLPIDNSVMRAYPNPAKDFLTVDYQVDQAGSVQVQLFDLQGRELMGTTLEQTPGSHQLDLNLSEMNQGVHILMMTTPSTRSIQRVLIQE